jgi:hypothetical protein
VSFAGAQLGRSLLLPDDAAALVGEYPLALERGQQMPEPIRFALRPRRATRPPDPDRVAPYRAGRNAGGGVMQ